MKRETPDTVKDLINEGNVDGSNEVNGTGKDLDDDEKDAEDDGPVRVPRKVPDYEAEIDSPPSNDPTNPDAVELGHELGEYASDSDIVSDDG